MQELPRVYLRVIVRVNGLEGKCWMKSDYRDVLGCIPASNLSVQNLYDLPY